MPKHKAENKSQETDAEKTKKITDEQKRALFDCDKCPAFCCAIYPRVSVSQRDVKRLAKYFELSLEEAERRFTKMYYGERVLRRKKDHIFGEACKFLDPQTRGCTIYHARPQTCREYPTGRRCAYFDVMQWERRHQDDATILPIIRLEFRDVNESGSESESETEE